MIAHVPAERPLIAHDADPDEIAALAIEQVAVVAPFVAVITADASDSRPPIENVRVVSFVRSSVLDWPASEAVARSGVVGAVGAVRSIRICCPSFAVAGIWFWYASIDALGVKRGWTVPSPQLAAVTVRVVPEPLSDHTHPVAAPALAKSAATMPVVASLSVSVHAIDEAFVGDCEVVVNDATVGAVRSTWIVAVDETATAGADAAATVTVPAFRRRPMFPSLGVEPGVTVTMYGPAP